MLPELTETIAKKVLKTVDAGLSNGLGNRKPGEMCIEAAVCYAYGLPHGDNPPCVGAAVRAYKIRLNDSRWSSKTARAAGMRGLAIAQLGSDVIDQQAFRKLVVEGVIRRVLPIAMRVAANVCKDPAKAERILVAAQLCEQNGDGASAKEAQAAADASADAAYAKRDEVLIIAADVALQALIKLESPGCKYLYLLDQ